MNKLLIITIILAFSPILQTVANEIEKSAISGVEESIQVMPEFNLDKKSVEAKTYKASRRIALGSIFLSYSGMLTLGIIPLVYSSANIFFSVQGMFGTIFSIAIPTGFFIPGIIMLVGGVKYYQGRRQNCDVKVLAKYYKTKIRNWEITSTVTGIISSVGLTLGGIGAGMICGGIIKTYNEALFTGGVIFSTIGGMMLFSALPVMITSLAMSAWLKGQANRLSVDIGITSGSTGELLGDKRRNVFEKPNGVALALSVKF